MRFKIAVPALVIGVLLMLVGIAQLTFLSPSETVTASVPAGTESGPVTVIDAGAKEPGADDVDITVRSEGTFTLAVGRASDVDAWVGDAAHLRVTGIEEDGLQTTFTDGEQTVPDPSGSDLWTSEETAEGSVTHRWLDPADGDWSILLASDGENPAPTNVSITWPNDETTVWAVPLIVIGALIVLIGIALFFRKPKRERPPTVEGSRAHQRALEARNKQGRKGGAQFSVAVVVMGLTASGLSAAHATTSEPSPSPATSEPSPSPATSEPSPSPATSEPSPSPAAEETGDQPPVVLESQLERILASVATVVAEGDAAADADLLAPRTAEAALALRTANYAVRADASEIPEPTPVAAEPILTTMISSDPSWPRTVVALTQSEDNPVPQALVLVQADPRSNYQLSAAIQMLPGTTFPSSEGSAGVAQVPLDNAPGLAYAPQTAMNAIADFLSEPDGDNADTFEENSFAEAITSFQSDVVADPDNDSADITFVHASEPDYTHALATSDGGAMVFGYLNHTYSSVPRGSRDSIDLDGTVYESLTGETSTDEGIDVRYGEAVMMYIPTEESGERVRVVGAAQQFLSAELR
ncbi:hypothetical protein [Arthrobacter sp. CAN_C5]|uniref:hypothetical protein n=1 Tax=Arthrobacter sp. CAN_C5 TaxID=2760706 RepID=UPI001AE6D840|nr:hypothetical protein [Arthrobacter sp. CAN_C5]MBP2216160.1 putative membrane protein [Arthrobacter sp. CAN_C5]